MDCAIAMQQQLKIDYVMDCAIGLQLHSHGLIKNLRHDGLHKRGFNYISTV